MPALLLLGFLTAATHALAQDDAARKDLRIGTKPAPPFAMKTPAGEWEGISIDLLAAVAAKLGVKYVLQETTLAGMVDDVAAGRLDASIAAMTMTGEREQVIDFSYGYYQSGLGAAVAEQRPATITAIVEGLFSRAFLSVIGLLCAVLFAVGALAWVLEHRHNPTQFERDPKRGLFSGFWWAAVTMTTTGYGDKAPTTVAGRILAILWMFTALIITASFTAQLAATLTAGSIRIAVSQPDDLRQVRVGIVDGAASGDTLRGMGVRPSTYPDVPAGLAAVAGGEIDAFVHDRPILAWEVPDVPGVILSPVDFAPQDYAIVLPPDTPLRETVNRALLEVLASPDWADIRQRYLGTPH